MPPATSCVSCGESKRTKLLKCLHCLCFGCLPKHLTRLNEVRCPDCTELTPSPSWGKAQWQSLPDSYAAGSVSGRCAGDGEQRKQAVLLCDECHEDELAVSKCADCKQVLCEYHATGHARNRSTYQHHVKTIPESISSTGSVATIDQRPVRQILEKRCIIHSGCKLQSFCHECNDFLCELCLKSGHDAGHSEMSVENAVAMMRSRVEASVGSRSAATADGEDDSGSVVSEAIESVSNAIKELHDRTESTSEQVQEYFNGIVELVKARESCILDDLDQLRSGKLLPLEEQKLRLQKSQSTHETISGLLSSCDDPYDFLRMASWLEEAASKATGTAEKYAKPCVVSKLVFILADESKLTAAIAGAGAVVDAADIAAVRSTITCAPTVQVNQDLCMEVEALNQAGQAINPEVALVSCKVEVMSPNADSVECAPVAGEDGKRLIFTFRPSGSGKHCVTAKHRDCHLIGSPAEVIVRPQCTFNPDRCHANIQLSNDNRTARNTGGSYRSVCGAEVYKAGHVELRMRLDTVVEGQGMIFLCNSSNPTLDTYQHDDTAWGWYGRKGNRRRKWCGSRLGQKWQSGDVIRLSLDCDRHTLTGCHERTGTTETLSDVHGDLYLYVSLDGQNTQATIL